MEENLLLEKIKKILEDKKAIDLKVIDARNRNSLADFLIIASGTSSTHVHALAENVEVDLKKENIYPYKVEGYHSDSWILMDYSNIIVNIFTVEDRAHYNLEELWEKAR